MDDSFYVPEVDSSIWYMENVSSIQNIAPKKDENNGDEITSMTFIIVQLVNSIVLSLNMYNIYNGDSSIGLVIALIVRMITNILYASFSADENKGWLFLYKIPPGDLQSFALLVMILAVEFIVISKMYMTIKKIQRSSKASSASTAKQASTKASLRKYRS